MTEQAAEVLRPEHFGGGAATLPLPEEQHLPVPEAHLPLPAAHHLPAVAHPRPLGLALKRTFDVAGALLLLLVLAPVFLAIAVLIKLDSPGPIFFRQGRVGRGGDVFEMRKFRTMIRDADAHKLNLLHMNEAAEGLFKIREDPRVTRFGRLLRSTSLDELPQLLHVISGRMSLVGPRPLVPEEDARIAGRDRLRLRMRPGMTGPWQVAGASQIPIDEMARLDYDYLSTWSIWRDLQLLFGTIPHVVMRRGL